MHRPGPAEKPKVLILDDSTSAVDTATDAAFARPLPGKSRTPPIYHRPAGLQRVRADRILVLDDGVISGLTPMRTC